MQLEQGFALYRRGPGFTSINLLLSRSRFWLTGTTLIELGSWSVMVFTINKKIIVNTRAAFLIPFILKRPQLYWSSLMIEIVIINQSNKFCFTPEVYKQTLRHCVVLSSWRRHYSRPVMTGPDIRNNKKLFLPVPRPQHSVCPVLTQTPTARTRTTPSQVV